MKNVPGTRGYEKVIEIFSKASFDLKFEEINADFMEFLPALPARVLDAGAGIGQNSSYLCRQGYDVVAIEPLKEFLDIARTRFGEQDICWIQDSLPLINELNAEPFDFILVDGVWHHLNPNERRLCISRFSGLLPVGGICAISLRNGPAGAGKHVFATNTDELVGLASDYGFEVIYKVENQPSKMKNKPGVFWARVVLKKV